MAQNARENRQLPQTRFGDTWTKSLAAKLQAEAVPLKRLAKKLSAPVVVSATTSDQTFTVPPPPSRVESAAEPGPIAPLFDLPANTAVLAQSVAPPADVVDSDLEQSTQTLTGSSGAKSSDQFKQSGEPAASKASADLPMDVFASDTDVLTSTPGPKSSTVSVPGPPLAVVESIAETAAPTADISVASPVVEERAAPPAIATFGTKASEPVAELPLPMFGQAIQTAAPPPPVVLQPQAIAIAAPPPIPDVVIEPAALAYATPKPEPLPVRVQQLIRPKNAVLAVLAPLPSAAEPPQPTFVAPVKIAESAPESSQTQQFAGMPAGKAPIASPVIRDIAPPAPQQAAYSAARSGDSASALTYDDELILQIQSQRGEIADTITGYGTQAGVYLPLGAVARFLDLAITVSDQGNYASGWFIDEKQTLSINLRQGTLLVNGQEVPLAKGDAIAFDGELFLKADKFSDLLPLALIVDLRGQTVTVKTRVPFPFEQRIEREAQRDMLAGRNGSRQKHRWPRQDSPYQALAFPVMDVDLRAVSDSTYGTRAESDLRLAGDLAFMTARAFISGTSRDGLTGARIELGRRDPDSKLLGPLKASEYRIGDVSTIAMPIGLRGTSGRGGFITNAPLERASVFDTVDLRGDLPDGYEVELYRNNILIGSTRDKTDGEYRFLKVTVDYGLNVFRLVFFGPQGQRREEVRQYSVGDGRLGAGEFVYSAGSAQKDVNLFDVHGPNFSPAPDRGAWRSSALLQYGLSRQVTALLGGSYFDGVNGQQWQATAGLRTGIASTAIKLDLGYQSGGGKAVEVGLGGKLAGVGYTLTHAEYSGRFTDEVRSFGGEFLKRASELNLNTTVNLGSKDSPLPIPLYGQIRQFEYTDGRKQADASLQGSLAFSRYLASASLNFSTASTPGFASNTQMTGSFDLSRMAGSRLRLRGAVDYGVLPKLEITGGQLEADYTLDDRTSLRASVGHVINDGRTYFGLSAIRRFGKFTLAFDGSYGVPRRDYRAALRLGFSFGRNPLSGGLFVTEPGLASGGAIAARAFRDANGNQRLDSGEEVLPGVDFGTSSRNAATDKNGVALIGGLGDGSRNSLVIDRATLPDLNLAPVSDGIEVISRAGHIQIADFALLELSDVAGTAYFSEGEGLGQAVSGLRLEIADDSGKVLGKTRTEADGTYFFEQIPPGVYTIQIDKNQAISLKIHLAQTIKLTVGAKGGSLNQVVKVARDE